MVTMRLALPPVDEIQERAKTINPAKVIAGLLLAIPMVLGWLAAKICVGVWAVLKIAIAAVQIGWQNGLNSKPGDSS